MAVKVGETSVSDIQFGTTQIDKVYKGTDVVWEAPFYGVRGVTTSPSDFSIGADDNKYTCHIIGDNGDGTYNFEYKGKMNGYKLFALNTNLVKVTVLSLPKESTNIAELFNSCSNLEEIDELSIPVPVIANAVFHDARLLQNIPSTIASLITPICTTVRSFFSYAVSMDIDVSHWNTQGILTISDMNCFNGLGDFTTKTSRVTFGAGFFNTMVNISIPIYAMQDYASAKSMLDSIIANSKSIPYGTSGSYWGSQEEFNEWDGTQVITLHANIKNVINNNADLVALRDEAINCGWVIQ